MVLRVDSLSGAAPSDAQVTAKEQSIAQPKIDKQTLNKMPCADAIRQESPKKTTHLNRKVEKTIRS